MDHHRHNCCEEEREANSNQRKEDHEMKAALVSVKWNWATFPFRFTMLEAAIRGAAPSVADERPVEGLSRCLFGLLVLMIHLPRLLSDLLMMVQDPRTLQRRCGEDENLSRRANLRS
jgi:hypothetical protein